MVVPYDLNQQQLSAASRLFSPTVFRELANLGRSPTFSRLAKELIPLGLVKTNSKVSDLFDSTFEVLTFKNYRHECIYKNAIANKILLGKHSLNTAVLLEEFRVGKSKADVVVLNGTSNVYEIKSERDTLKRLKSQIDSYRKVFANINLIVGENHLDSTIKTTPEEIGILLLSDRYQISTIRESSENLEKIDPAAIYESIQLAEAKSILRNLNIPIPNLPNTQIFSALRGEFSKLPKEKVHDSMITTLKEKRSQVKLANLLESVPKSMISTAISTRISFRDQSRLLSALDTPIDMAISWG